MMMNEDSYSTNLSTCKTKIAQSAETFLSMGPNGQLMAWRRIDIIWTNDDLVYWRISVYNIWQIYIYRERERERNHQWVKSTFMGCY